MIGTTVSHYRILEQLGVGGMGVVYRAEDLVLGRPVALKFLPDSLAEEPEALARFQREARAASALNHPHICTIYELAEEDGRNFIVMELMDGQTLKYSAGGKPMPVDRIVRFGAQVADALEAAHGTGIIHRDIKPANLFVTRRGDAKVLDFGLAKITEKRARAELSRPAPTDETELAPDQLTTPGAALGTIAYMSPEQVLGEEVDERTDLFSLGVVLYEMATGRQPFRGETAGAVFNQILNAPAPAPARLNPELSEGLEHLLAKALEKDRALRYQSARDLRADLERLRRGTVAAASAAAVETAGPRPPASRKGAWVGLGAAAALLLAVGAGLWLGKGAEPPEEVAGEAAASAAPAATSIAVLPFADMSPESDQEYLSDGLAEELLNVLSRIPELRVAARTSAFSFKGKDVDITTVGERLNVARVLEGSVRKVGNRVRIRAQLVNASDGFHLWSKSFDRELDDIFAVQDEIARSVAEALAVTLLGDAASPSRVGGDNVEAYNLYLQARYFTERWSADNLEKAVTLLDEALSLEPEYALGWAQLADARLRQAEFGYLPLPEALERARAAIDRALELDPSLARGWAALGRLKTHFEWDWAGAAEAVERAQTVDPANADVLHAQGILGEALGRTEQMTEIWRRTTLLDPLNTHQHWHLGFNLYFLGRLDEAEAAFAKMIDLQPELDYTHTSLARVELARSRPEAALAEAELEPDAAWRVYALALANHALGREQEADAQLAALIDGWQDVAAFQVAEVYGFRGEVDPAFEWLERAYAQRDSGVAWTKRNPLFKSLHADPRWVAFLDKLGLAAG